MSDAAGVIAYGLWRLGAADVERVFVSCRRYRADMLGRY